MSVAIIDYGSGNLRSAAKAFERAAAENAIDQSILVTSDPKAVGSASHIVLPGVGAFGDCRAGLYGVPGMVETLQREVIERGKPFIGICVGMQLMATRGVEHGIHPGLDWIKGDVVRIQPKDAALKIPHMGWNVLESLARHPVLAGVAEAGRCQQRAGADRLRRPDRRHGRARQHGGYPVPSRKKPGDGIAADRQFPALAAVRERS